MKRPASLVEVTQEAKSTQALGYAIAEFLDEFYRRKDPSMLAEEPPSLREHLHDDGLADAYLAAVAVHLSQFLNKPSPAWTRAEQRFLHSPWFANAGSSLRASLLLESPPAFRERNLFVSGNALERA